MDIDFERLSEYESREIRRLLLSCPNDPPHLEDIWRMMDDVWDKLGCDNRDPNPACLKEFYGHPVWTLNGFFVEQHALSMRHRNAVANWIVEREVDRVLDYGGGFGTQARLIAGRDADVKIDIYEPYPSRVAMGKVASHPNVRFVSAPEGTYDCAIARDVLEHLGDPLEALATIIESVSRGGFLIIANHFYPSIKCHLPRTFHLRYTFKLFAGLMGLRTLEVCQKGHAIIYHRDSETEPNWRLLRTLETISSSVFPLLRAGHSVYNQVIRERGNHYEKSRE